MPCFDRERRVGTRMPKRAEGVMLIWATAPINMNPFRPLSHGILILGALGDDIDGLM